MRSLALAAAVFAVAPVDAATVITDWTVPDGLPSAVTPPWTLVGSGANVGTGGGAMTMSGQTYWLEDATTVAGFNTGRAFAIEARVRFVNGRHSLDSREGVNLVVTTGNGVGNGLYIGNGRIFVNAADVSRGATAFVDTLGFHTYRLAVGAPDAVSGLSSFNVSYDGVATLTGSTFYSQSYNGKVKRVLFGGGSLYASATSQWQFVRNAAIGTVPEPAAWTLMVAGFGLVGAAVRRRAALTVAV